MRWLVRSIHLYPMHWGCWLEMTSLIGRVEDVSILSFLRYVLLTIPAQSNSTSSSTKYHVLHIPPSYFTRTIPIHAQSLKLPRSASLHISYKSILDDLPGITRLPYERLHDSRCPLQPTSRSPSSQTRLTRPLFQHPLCHESPAQTLLPRTSMLNNR